MTLRMFLGLLVIFLTWPVKAVVTEPAESQLTDFDPSITIGKDIKPTAEAEPNTKEKQKIIENVLQPLFPIFPNLPDILPQIIDNDSEQDGQAGSEQEDQEEQDLGQQEQEIEEQQDPEPGSRAEYEQLVEQGKALIEAIEAQVAENEAVAEELGDKAVEVARVKYLADFLKKLNTLYAGFGTVSQETLSAIQSASQAHVAWIDEFRAEVRLWRPDWSGVVDVTTYKTAYSQIAAFKRGIPDDQNVLYKEKLALELLTERSYKIQEIIGRLTFLTETNVYTEMLDEVNAQSLLEKSVRIKNALFNVLAAVQRPVVMMTAQQMARRKLLVDIPRQWHRMLAGVMQRIIQENAIEMTDQFLRSMSDPVLYYDAKYKIAQSGAKVESLLFTDYCPKLATRQLMIHKELLRDIEANLPTLFVTEPIRDQIQIEVNGGWNAYNTYKDVLDSFTEEDRQFMFEYRVSRVQNRIANLNPEVQKQCIQSGELLSHWNDQADDDCSAGLRSAFEHEMEYKEFMEKCTVN